MFGRRISKVFKTSPAPRYAPRPYIPPARVSPQQQNKQTSLVSNIPDDIRDLVLNSKNNTKPFITEDKTAGSCALYVTTPFKEPLLPQDAEKWAKIIDASGKMELLNEDTDKVIPLATKEQLKNLIRYNQEIRAEFQFTTLVDAGAFGIIPASPYIEYDIALSPDRKNLIMRYHVSEKEYQEGRLLRTDPMRNKIYKGLHEETKERVEKEPEILHADKVTLTKCPAQYRIVVRINFNRQLAPEDAAVIDASGEISNHATKEQIEALIRKGNVKKIIDRKNRQGPLGRNHPTRHEITLSEDGKSLIIDNYVPEQSGRWVVYNIMEGIIDEKSAKNRTQSQQARSAGNNRGGLLGLGILPIGRI